MDNQQRIEGNGDLILLDGQRFPVTYSLAPQSNEQFPHYSGVIRGSADVIKKAAKVQSYFTIQLSDGRRIEGRVNKATPDSGEAQFSSTSSIHNPATTNR